MQRIVYSSLCLFGLLSTFLITEEAVAQVQPAGLKVDVNVLSNRVGLGEFGTLIYKITGGDAKMPAQIEVEGLEVTHSGQQSSISITNGVRMIETTHFYRFRGNEPGTYTIPPLTVTVGRTPLTSRSVEVTLYERDQNEVVDATRPFFAKLVLPKTEFYVNELVPFDLTAYVKGRNSIQDIVQPRFEHESFVIRNFRDVKTDGGELGNSYYSSAVLPSTLFALKPGEIRLGPAEIGVRIQDASSGFGFSSFFNRTVLREMASNTVNVSVKPLPNGAPISFTGGVGKFSLKATPSTTEVSVGDPISMEFVITGAGNLRTMSVPRFSTPQTDIWKTYDASKELDEDNDSDGLTEGRVVFSQVIIPEAKVNMIPSFEFSYFDPTEEVYVTEKTEPIPIQVTADSTQASAPMIRPGETPAAFPDTPNAQRPVASYDDMLYIRTTPPRWIAAGDLQGNSLWFYFVQLVFSTAFFSLLAFGAFRWWKDREERRTAHDEVLSYRDALKRIPKNGSSRRDYYQALSTAILLWQKEHPEAPSQVDEVIDRVQSRCDSVLYSGSTDLKTPVSERERAEFQSILQKLPKK